MVSYQHYWPSINHPIVDHLWPLLTIINQPTLTMIIDHWPLLTHHLTSPAMLLSHPEHQDKAGIDASAESVASSLTGGYGNDDTKSFGAYREHLGATIVVVGDAQ